MNDQYRTRRESLLLVIVACGLSACAGHTLQSSSVSRATPRLSPGLVIQQVWKGHVAAINKNVLVIWIVPADTSAPGTAAAAYTIIRNIKQSLRKSDLQVVIVKATASRGVLSTTSSFAFVRTASGDWKRLDDEVKLDRLMSAGL